ncbi:hypothetical protein KM043_004729 [Ampulex compressa]|nr:hypothetical protein KM043_004729 [Ampulex compressa]
MHRSSTTRKIETIAASFRGFYVPHLVGPAGAVESSGTGKLQQWPLPSWISLQQPQPQQQPTRTGEDVSSHPPGDEARRENGQQNSHRCNAAFGTFQFASTQDLDSGFLAEFRKITL